MDQYLAFFSFFPSHFLVNLILALLLRPLPSPISPLVSSHSVVLYLTLNTIALIHHYLLSFHSPPLVLCFSVSLPSSQAARHSHTAVEWNGNMVIYGGELANGALASDVWMYRPLQDDWQQLGLSNSLGAPKLANHAAAVVDNYLYVFGGEFNIIPVAS